MVTQQSPPAEGPSTGLAQAVLWLCGACYLVLGLGLTPTAYLLFTLDPEIPDALAQPLGIGFAVVLFVVGVGIGGVNVAAAVGLRAGARWAWYLAMALGGLYLVSSCMPLGAVILWQCSQESTRRFFVD